MTTNEFGDFFRMTRQGIGLSIRDFCRRTGFDKANVSRLERGLMSPPKSEEVLKAYAKGLKLKQDSQEWERFMALAKPPVKQRRGLSHRNWITANHLQDWAETLDARSTLPQLIRRLIRATAQGIIVPVESPAGEQTQRPGWDVLVETGGESEFVPQGASGWEIGASEDPKKKAEADWIKRLKTSNGVSRRNGIFVFVTPRKWGKKRDWVEEKTKLKKWKKVLVYDSASLEEWLECAPAVDVWLARRIGLCPPGLIDVDSSWRNLKALTAPSLKAEVFLASRGKQFEELKEWVKGPPDTLLIESRSPAEAVDFVVAASRELELEEMPERGEWFASRTLIVETRDAWRSIAGGDAKLVLVAHPILAIEAELVAEAVCHGHHVILCTSSSPGLQHRKIELRRVSSLDLQKTLEAQGVEHKEAARLTTAAGGSIEVLKRITSRHPGTIHPEWSQRPHVQSITPLLLAGRWDDTFEGDRIALGKLAGAEYREVVARAERWSACPDPVLTRTLSRWELVSRDDSWALSSHGIRDSNLEQFEKIALEVLGELDPACELPSNQRWLAAAYDKIRRHSGSLRRGLAESLALLGARPPDNRMFSQDPGGLAEYIVKRLLEGKDWKAWASLSSELPLLAEAAPNAFLNALEIDLRKRSPEVVDLFDTDSSSFLGSTPYRGLLLALEGLSWNRKLLPRVCLLLAHLQEAVPLRKSGNSPLGPLVMIFMPLFPQTTAPVEERVTILNSIATKHPESTWRLLLELLPKPFLGALEIHRPAFQNWALSWSEEVNPADLAFFHEAASDLIVQIAENDPHKLKEAINVFENLSLSAATKIIDRIMTTNPTNLMAEVRQALTKTIREKVISHRRVANAALALQAPMLEELDRVRIHIEMNDSVARSAWLFGEDWKVQQMVSAGIDDEDAEKKVNQFRTNAIQEVRAERKWDGILELAGVAVKPIQVGETIAATNTAGDDSLVLPALLTDRREKFVEFAKGYVRMKIRLNGWKWIEKLAVDQWSDDQVVEFTLAQPSEPVAWDFISNRGARTELEYWKRLPHLCYNKSAADVSRACSMLINAARPFFAVRQLVMARNRLVKMDTALIIEVLEQGRESLSDPQQQLELNRIHDSVTVLIEDLQNRMSSGEVDIDVDKLAFLEWAYLQYLDGYAASPKTLHLWLDQKPKFFVELLTMLSSKNDELEERRKEPTEQERSLAQHIYHLLNTWKRVPGTQPDGTIDGDALRTWIKSVQSSPEYEARRELGDEKIGKMFAYAPYESNLTWPCIPVRDAIEEFGSKALTDGFEVGIINTQPPYSKSFHEGGVQEQERAKKYFGWAEVSRIEWPKTASSLHRVGERFKAYARREDAEAEAR